MKKLFFICLFLLFILSGCDKQEESLDDNKDNEVKFNLNDNIEVVVNTESTGNSDCFFYMFATNLSDVFSSANIKKEENYNYVSYWSGNALDKTDGEIAEEDLVNNLSSLKFDKDKENDVVNLFKEYKTNKYTGLSNIDYSFENHRFMYSYDYLTFKDKSYETEGEEFNDKVQSLLIGSTRFNGPCGGFDFAKEEILNEELCNEYNLTCDRW